MVKIVRKWNDYTKTFLIGLGQDGNLYVKHIECDCLMTCVEIKQKYRMFVCPKCKTSYRMIMETKRQKRFRK